MIEIKSEIDEITKQRYYPETKRYELNLIKPKKSFVEFFKKLGIKVNKKRWGALLRNISNLLTSQEFNKLNDKKKIKTLIKQIIYENDKFIPTYTGYKIDKVGEAFFRNEEDLMRFEHYINNIEKYKHLKKGVGHCVHLLY